MEMNHPGSAVAVACFRAAVREKPLVCKEPLAAVSLLICSLVLCPSSRGGLCALQINTLDQIIHWAVMCTSACICLKEMHLSGFTLNSHAGVNVPAAAQSSFVVLFLHESKQNAAAPVVLGENLGEKFFGK